MRHSLILLSSLCATWAVAADTSPTTPTDVDAIFAALDQDDDGRISEREAHADKALHERFAGVDSNRDGYISRDEFHARPSDKSFE